MHNKSQIKLSSLRLSGTDSVIEFSKERQLFENQKDCVRIINELN